MFDRGTGDQHLDLIFVLDLDRQTRILGLGDELDARAEAQCLSLQVHRRLRAVIGLAPCIDDPRRAVAHAIDTRGGLRCVAVEVQLEVVVGDVLGLALGDDLAAFEQHRPVAEAVDRAHVMCHEHDRCARVAQAIEDVKALLLEGRVADGKHLVDQQDVGVDLDRDRKCEPDMHPG